ncbi:hypothetical protein [Paraburkholderia sp. BL17N1]|uniref:hypothetical protein n=1 Tax=Paraburkholderia sp. BL17N1 TaxID=1938798 RepID=UPI0011C476FD|nr:hypothetical protein [Paraburkholderia sp. BL17N1]
MYQAARVAGRQVRKHAFGQGTTALRACPELRIDFHARAAASCAKSESDADPLVLIRQLANEKPLPAEELERMASLDTEVPIASIDRLDYWPKLSRRFCETPVAGAPQSASCATKPPTRQECV